MIHAVNGVSFSLASGEVLGILGESGSGKSVTLRALMRLLPDNCDIAGHVRLGGEELNGASAARLEQLRGRQIAMIFQEPMTALDPVFTIGAQIAEAIVRHEGLSRRDARRRALELLERVQIPSARRRLDSYPHEMSGGMRQRAMIAVALSCNPKVLLADEPTTALDVTVQIQILLLLRELQRELGMAVVFVTHDVGAAVEISDRLAVMYGGRFVETGDVRQIMRNAAHPYTQGLLAANLHGIAARHPPDDDPGRAAEPRGTAARLQFRPALRLRAPGLRCRSAAGDIVGRRPSRPLPAGDGSAGNKGG